MKWTTSCASEELNDLVLERQVLRRGVDDVDTRMTRASRLDERFRRIGRGHRGGTEPRDQLGRQGARPAPDIQDVLPGLHPGQIGQLGRQQDREAAHEPVIRLGGDVEAHGPECYTPTYASELRASATDAPLLPSPSGYSAPTSPVVSEGCWGAVSAAGKATGSPVLAAAHLGDAVTGHRGGRLEAGPDGGPVHRDHGTGGQQQSGSKRIGPARAGRA